MEVVQLGGLDSELYPLIGPLVMNPKVLKANNNYPFKTTEHYQWYIATDEQKAVMGFLPVERRSSGLVINNYYIADNEEVLALLFNSIRTDQAITAVVLTEHADMFARLGFSIEHKWTKYIKMTYTTNKNEEEEKNQH